MGYQHRPFLQEKRAQKSPSLRNFVSSVLYGLLFMLLSTLVHPPVADAGLRKLCSHLLKKAKGEVVWSDERVEIIYFPTGHHTKVRVGDDVWAYIDERNKREHRNIEVLDRLSQTGLSNGAQIRFRIRVTEEELELLKEKTAKGQFFGNNCTHLACRLINQNTGAVIPPMLNYLPHFNGLYLALMRLVPWSRVTEVDLRYHSMGPHAITYSAVGLVMLGVELVPIGFASYFIYVFAHVVSSVGGG